MFCWKFFKRYDIWKRIQRFGKTDVNLEAKTSNTTYTIIDKNGKVYGTYSNVTAYGYGYTVVETYTSGYKEAYYQYDIYSPSGKIVYTYNTETNEKQV